MSHILKIGTCFIVSMGMIGTLSAYRKFCYTSHNYAGLQGPCSDPETIAQSKKMAEQGRAVHTFTYTYGGRQCVVRLSRRDLKKVRDLLQEYDKELIVDSSFIAKFLEAHKERHAVVGWIMQDFHRVNPGLTIGKMLTILGL